LKEWEGNGREWMEMDGKGIDEKRWECKRLELFMFYLSCHKNC
jgi:hypothetical protein